VRTPYSVLTQTQTVQYSLLHTYAIRYSLLLLGYKHVQRVTVQNTVGNCNTVVSIIILYYNIMGPPSYMRSVVDRNVVIRRMAVYMLAAVEDSSACESNPKLVISLMLPHDKLKFRMT